MPASRRASTSSCSPSAASPTASRRSPISPSGCSSDTTPRSSSSTAPPRPGSSTGTSTATTGAVNASRSLAGEHTCSSRCRTSTAPSSVGSAPTWPTCSASSTETLRPCAACAADRSADRSYGRSMSIRPRLSAPLRAIIRLSAAVALVLPLAGAVTALVVPSAPAAAVTIRSTPQLQAGATPDPTTGSTRLYATVSPPAGADPSAPVPTGSVHLTFVTDSGRHFDSGTYALDANGHVEIDDAFSNSSHLYTFSVAYSGD